MKVHIEVSEKTVKQLVVDYIARVCGNGPPKAEDVRIEVKSKQNYFAEWERADFRVVYESMIVGNRPVASTPA